MVRVLIHAGNHPPHTAPRFWTTSQLRQAQYFVAGRRESEGLLCFRLILFVWNYMLGLTAMSPMTDDEKDLEIS